MVEWGEKAKISLFVRFVIFKDRTFATKEFCFMLAIEAINRALPIPRVEQEKLLNYKLDETCPSARTA